MSPEPYDPEPTREAVLADIRRVGRELGEAPTKRQMVEHGHFSEYTYTRKFDSYSELVEQAGLEPQRQGPYLDDPDNIDEIEEDVRRVSVYLEREPTIREMVRFGRFTAHAYQRAHGSYSDLLDVVDVEE